MKFEVLAIGEEKPDFVSRRIQSFLGTDYSHCAILVADRWCYHATEQGFNMVPWIHVAPGHIIRHRFAFELDPARTQFSLGWLHASLGKEYSESQYLGFLFPFLRRFVANDRSKTVCSEAVGQFLFDCVGVKHGSLHKCDFLSPKDVVEICYASRG